MSDEATKCDKSKPAAVTYEFRQQAGFEIYVGQCPACGLSIAVNGPGKLICSCGQLLIWEKT